MRISVNKRTLGQMAEAKAAKVLKGAKLSFIPIETLEPRDATLNMKTAKAGHTDVFSSFLKAAARVIE